MDSSPEWFDKFVLELKPMKLLDKHSSLYYLFRKNDSNCERYFERLVPDHIDYVSLSGFAKCMSIFFTSKIKTKQVEYLLSIYGWDDNMNDEDASYTLFRILSGEIQQEIATYYHVYVKIIGDHVTNLRDDEIYLLYSCVFNYFSKNQQEEITCLILDRNLTTPKIIFDRIHHSYINRNSIKTIENVLACYGFDIHENSSNINFVKQKIMRNAFNDYANLIEPEIASETAIEIILETIRHHNIAVAISCKKILLDGASSGIDIGTILLNKLTKNNE
jgi:hypothetical protein